MNITSIAALATDLTQSKTAESASIAVLKKSIDFQSANALALINSISTSSAGLGQRVNTMA